MNESREGDILFDNKKNVADLLQHGWNFKNVK